MRPLRITLALLGSLLALVSVALLAAGGARTRPMGAATGSSRPTDVS